MGTSPTLYDPQRERILAALEARQAEEGAPDYLALLPEAPAPRRRLTLREWLGLTFNRYTLYETLHGEPAPAIGCYCRECWQRAQKRSLRFWSWVYALVLITFTVVVAWRWTN